MALISFGPAVANASGSIGGTVFSHNRGGSYMRTRVVPVKIENVFTQKVRDAMSNCSRLWAGLDAEQREAWREFSAANPTVNRLGQSKTLGGHVVFNRINSRLLQQGVAVIDLPPVAAPPAAPLTFSAVLDASDQSGILTFTPTPLGANKHLWVWAAMPPSAGVSYIANRWRLVYQSAANVATGADIGGDLTARFGSFQADQVFYLRAQVLDATTGLVSSFISTAGTVQA